MAKAMFRSAAVALGALACVSSANAAATVHRLSGNGIAGARVAHEAVAPAVYGARWQEAALNPATATNQLAIILDGAPSADEYGQIAAEAAASFPLEADLATPLLLHELFTGRAAAPIRKGLGTLLTAKTEPAALHDIVAQLTEGDGLVLSVASSADALKVASPHRELVNAHPSWNIETVQLGAAAAGRETVGGRLALAADQLAAQDAARLRNAAGQQLFSLDTPADAAFLRELAAVKALGAELARAETAALVQDDAQDLITLALTSLAGLRATYGQTSEQYQTAWAQFNAAVPAAAAAMGRAYNGDARTTVVLVSDAPALDASAPAAARRAARALPNLPVRTRAQPLDPVDTIGCFPSEANCTGSTNACSGFGTCTEIPRDNADGGICFVCKCQYSYSGDGCQYYDISSIFWIIVFTVVFFIVSLVVVSTVVGYIDPGTGTLLFKTAAGGRPKSE